MKSNVVVSLLNSDNLNFQAVFLIIQLANVTLDLIVNKKNKTNKEVAKASKKGRIIGILGITCFLILTFTVISLFFSIKFFKTIFMIVNTSYLIYILVICPLLNIKLTYSFTEDSTVVASFLFTEILCFEMFCKYETLTNPMGEDIIIQFSTIITIIIKLLLIAYFIILSTYNIIRNFNILILDNWNLKIKNTIEKIDTKYNFEYLDNALNCKKCLIIKLLIFFVKSILWVLMVLIIRGFLFSLFTIYTFISSFFKDNSNNIFFILSKLSLILSLFVTYCIITLTNDFNASVVSVFELIISTIIIPIILEILLSKSNA